jgi:DNA-binding PadR family transcriptional regulator
MSKITQPWRAELPSPLEELILRMLVEHPKMYGLEMVEASDGQLKRGTIYVTLQRMEKKGFVRSEQETQLPGATGLPRRLYSIDAPGEKALRMSELAAMEFAGGEVVG